MRIIFLLLTITTFIWSNIGNVGALKGTATIKRNSHTFDVKSGMVLEVKDKIITADRSQVQVILKDNTVVTIGSNSTFVFDAYQFGSKEESEVKMHIERGFFRSLTGKIGKLAPERFKVKTVSATIGIRGTDFSARVSEQKETIVCYKGKITVLIGDITRALDEGMMMELANGEVALKTLLSDKKLQVIDKKESIDKIKTDEISDAIHQEVESIVEKVEIPLDQPTIEFEDR